MKMEREQKLQVLRHIKALIAQTKCNANFLAIFESGRVLQKSDVAEIESISDAQKEAEMKAALFYMHLLHSNASNSFPLLLDAFKKTGQVTPFQLLAKPALTSSGLKRKRDDDSMEASSSTLTLVQKDRPLSDVDRKAKPLILDEVRDPKQLSEMICNHTKNTLSLKNDLSAEEVNARIELLKTMLSRERSLQELDNDIKPSAALLQEYVHPKIIKFLIESGACVTIVNNSYESLLHIALRSKSVTTADEIHELVSLLKELGFSNLLRMDIGLKEIPLFMALRLIELRPETVTLFLDAGASLNEVDSHMNGALYHCVVGNRSIPFIQVLVGLGADYRRMNRSFCNLAHECFKLRRFGHLRFFFALGVKAKPDLTIREWMVPAFKEYLCEKDGAQVDILDLKFLLNECRFRNLTKEAGMREIVAALVADSYLFPPARLQKTREILTLLLEADKDKAMLKGMEQGRRCSLLQDRNVHPLLRKLLVEKGNAPKLDRFGFQKADDGKSSAGSDDSDDYSVWDIDMFKPR